jgi:cyclic-di-AMP phosphodiesterase PgpH
MFSTWLSAIAEQPFIKSIVAWGYRAAIPLVGVLLMLGLWGSLALPMSSDTGVLEIGVPSPVNIRAPRSVEFVSDLRTEEARIQAESRPSNLVYTTDFSLPTEQKMKLNELLKTITSVRNDPTLDDGEQQEKLTNLPSATVVLSSTLAETIVALDDSEWDNVRRWTINTYDRALSEYSFEITTDALRQLREHTLSYWTVQLPTTQRELVVYFTSSFLRVNRTLDEQATRQRKEEARSSIVPVKVKVQAGESIVRVGDPVSPEMIEKARAVGALPSKMSEGSIAGMALFSALLAGTFMLYLLFIQKSIDVIKHPRPLLVIVLSLIVTALAARVLQPLWTDQAYAFPLATTILVLAVIFNSQIALSAAVLLSIFLGVLDNNALAMTTTMILGSTTAILVARGADRSLTLLLAGIAVALVTTLTQFTFCLLDANKLCWQELSSIMLFSGTNGGLSAILSLGLFNLVGNAAGVVTPLKLMELAHPAQPLLRKIIHEAPGTYYHSVAVANLAEAAADAIGADALLLRVGAYYHDIGKTLRPFFFTDNQTGRENVHNDLEPNISAEIIIDHVREGIKMARSAGLPGQIVDFIATHHGTQVVSHFYQLALRQQDSVNVKDFRYPGPIPWTREQGIMMLADSVEATVRAKVQHGKLASAHAVENGQQNGMQTVEQLVNSIIDERVRSGQLDNTSLTLRDLVLIRSAFITSLQSIYHPRVEYARQVVKT